MRPVKDEIGREEGGRREGGGREEGGRREGGREGLDLMYTCTDILMFRCCYRHWKGKTNSV